MATVKPDPGGFPQRKLASVPLVSVETMRAIQETAIEEFDLDVLQLMENAGRATALLALAMLGGKARGQRVVVLAGGGNNGAAGLCAARNLANWGLVVEPIFGTIEEDMSIPTQRQARILRASGIQEHHDRSTSEESLENHLKRADIVLDALAGYGMQGPLTGITAAATEMAVASGRPILALDVPTGVNAANGEMGELAIRATTTLALDLPKEGICAPRCREFVGALYLADLGVPRRVYDRFGIDTSGLFAEGPIVRLRA